MIYDARMIPNLKLRESDLDTAQAENIPVQISYVEGGATDGGAIHLHGIGVPIGCAWLWLHATFIHTVRLFIARIMITASSC